MKKRYSGSVGGTSTKSSYVGNPASRKLRGTHRLKYGNSVLTQDRVEQVFGYDFETGSYYGQECDDMEGNYELELTEEHFVPEEGYQYEMQLDNVDVVEGKLTSMILRYRDAIHAMGAQALLWNDLMEDIEDNEHLAAEFAKFQMLRKLSGGTM